MPRLVRAPSPELEQAKNYWVTTTRRSGAPHARPVWGLWRDNTFLFTVGPDAAAARNLAANPEVGVHLESGTHVVIVEGVAERFAEPPAGTLAEWVRKYPETPEDASIMNERVGYVVRPRVVLAWTLERFPDSLTRWREPLQAKVSS